jgi:hypothetical protein
MDTEEGVTRLNDLLQNIIYTTYTLTDPDISAEARQDMRTFIKRHLSEQKIVKATKENNAVVGNDIMSRQGTILKSALVGTPAQSNTAVTFTFTVNHNEIEYKTLYKQVANKYPTFSHADRELSRMIRDLENWTRKSPQLPSSIEQIIESRLKGHVAEFFRMVLMTKDIEAASTELLIRYGKVPTAHKAESAFFSHELHPSSMEKDLHTLLHLAMEANPGETQEFVEEKASNQAIRLLPNHHRDRVLQERAKFNSIRYHGMVAPPLSWPDLTDMILRTNDSPVRRNRIYFNTNESDSQDCRADLQSQTPYPNHEQVEIQKLREVCDNLGRAIQNMKTNQSQQVYHYHQQSRHQSSDPSTRGGRTPAMAGSQEAQEIGRDLEQNPAFDRRRTNNIFNYVRKFIGRRGYRLKDISIPEGQPLPYKYDRNRNILLQAKPFTGVLFSKHDPVNKSAKMSDSLLAHMSQHCFRCGEVFCSHLDERCVYAKANDTWCICSKCNSGFHLPSQCRTIPN